MLIGHTLWWVSGRSRRRVYTFIGHPILAQVDDRYMTAICVSAIPFLAKERHARSKVPISNGLGENPHILVARGRACPGVAT
jgi:hypothetical protein